MKTGELKVWHLLATISAFLVALTWTYGVKSRMDGMVTTTNAIPVQVLRITFEDGTTRKFGVNVWSKPLSQKIKDAFDTNQVAFVHLRDKVYLNPKLSTNR